MKQFYWALLIVLGVVMVYNPKFNVSLPSLGVIVLILGILGLARSLFNS
jgi:drug/metabolite transporter (DMT)-like permease